ncbi:MAG: hypothetical protein K9J13_14200 [Saprospiraceae bacterium]|nr:hypothetical protein [Saprospiraceae bacterium]
MTIWIITSIALWTNPIISFVLYKLTKKNQNTRKKLLRIFIGISILVITGLLSNISTTSTSADWIILALLHLSICFFIWIGLLQSNRLINLISALTLIVIFGIGYLLSTIGILGLGFITAEFESTKSIRINNNTVYKEFGVGNATTSWGGIKVCLYRNYSVFPIFERKFFEKSYIGGDEDDKSKFNIKPENSYVNNKPSFYANSFELTYDTVNQEIILSETYRKDTLHLRK